MVVDCFLNDKLSRNRDEYNFVCQFFWFFFAGIPSRFFFRDFCRAFPEFFILCSRESVPDFLQRFYFRSSSEMLFGIHAKKLREIPYGLVHGVFFWDFNYLFSMNSFQKFSWAFSSRPRLNFINISSRDWFWLWEFFKKLSLEFFPVFSRYFS